MQTPESATLLLWEVWVVTWLLAAIWSRRTVVRQPTFERILHTAFMSAGAILLYARSASFGALLQPLYPHVLWIGWAGVALVFAGLSYTWWARVTLGSLWSGNVTLKADHAIVRSGPYAITRHPIYTGLLAALVATAVIRDSGSAIAGFAFLLIGIVLKLRQEERLLTDHFGAEYQAYRAEVPALVPRLR